MKTLKTLLSSILPVAVLALGSGMLSGCSPSEAARVVSVGDRSVTVKTAKEGPPVIHEVAPDAKVTLDGKPAELTDLQPGDKVEVVTHPEDEPELPKEVAVAINAKRVGEPSAADKTDPTEPSDQVIARPREPGSNEPRPSEENQPRTNEDTAARTRDAPPPDWKRGLSVVPAPETSVHVLHEGEIGFVGENLVRLRYRDVPVPLAAEVVFRVTEETEILVNGKPAVIDDLRKGMPVVITAEQNGREFVAKRIEAKPELV